jgi:hypothetical protein
VFHCLALDRHFLSCGIKNRKQTLFNHCRRVPLILGLFVFLFWRRQKENYNVFRARVTLFWKLIVWKETREDCLLEFTSSSLFIQVLSTCTCSFVISHLSQNFLLIS